MTRLAHLAQSPRAGLWTILDHLADSHPDDHHDAITHLNNPNVSATELARALTRIARDDNIDTTVTEQSIRRHREQNA